jgi:glycosyltransferase involved in cell wall biosynthesis
MNLTKISIITPNFNGAKYLEETILSVLGQNYPDLEYIIIDGGSDDGSIDIIKKYEKKLSYWISEPDNGMYEAIQKGFDKSTGEIMAWINSDDMYHRNAFFTIAEIFDTLPEVNWVVGASTVYDESGRTVCVSQSRQFTKFDFCNHDFKWLQQESVFWRRSLWKKAGAYLNRNLKYSGDFELWLRFFQYEKLYVTHALIGGFRWRRVNQISLEHLEDYLQETNSVIEKVVLEKKDKKILRNYQKLHWVISKLKKCKLIRTDWIIKRYRLKYFPQHCEIIFTRDKMKFEIKD